MPSRNAYPRTVAACLDDSLRYKPATLRALRQFRRWRPWRGDETTKRRKISALHAALCEIYGKRTALAWDPDVPSDADSGGSYYRRDLDGIMLAGRVSVVTYLHEFAHALGRGEPGACRWSLTLFRRMFPRSWARLTFEGHVVRRGERAS